MLPSTTFWRLLRLLWRRHVIRRVRQRPVPECAKIGHHPDSFASPLHPSAHRSVAGQVHAYALVQGHLPRSWSALPCGRLPLWERCRALASHARHCEHPQGHAACWMAAASPWVQRGGMARPPDRLGQLAASARQRQPKHAAERSPESGCTLPRRCLQWSPSTLSWTAASSTVWARRCLQTAHPSPSQQILSCATL